MHRGNHSPNRLTLSLALALLLALGACAPFARPDPPGLLGALIDRAPPTVQVKASGPYGDPLAEPVEPLLSTDIADQIVGAPLRSVLEPGGAAEPRRREPACGRGDDRHDGAMAERRRFRRSGAGTRYLSLASRRYLPRPATAGEDSRRTG